MNLKGLHGHAYSVESIGSDVAIFRNSLLMLSAIYEYQKIFLLWEIELHYKLPVDKIHLGVVRGLI